MNTSRDLCIVVQRFSAIKRAPFTVRSIQLENLLSPIFEREIINLVKSISVLIYILLSEINISFGRKTFLIRTVFDFPLNDNTIYFSKRRYKIILNYTLFLKH